jgi:hypothetical protein
VAKLASEAIMAVNDLAVDVFPLPSLSLGCHDDIIHSFR